MGESVNPNCDAIYFADRNTPITIIKDLIGPSKANRSLSSNLLEVFDVIFNRILNKYFVNNFLIIYKIKLKSQ